MACGPIISSIEISALSLPQFGPQFILVNDTESVVKAVEENIKAGSKVSIGGESLKDLQGILQLEDIWIKLSTLSTVHQVLLHTQKLDCRVCWQTM